MPIKKAPTPRRPRSKAPAPARFVVFEGIDGAGKTSLMAAVARRLRARGLRCLEVRQPGSTPLGELLRMALKNTEVKMDSVSELLLLAASFRQCAEEVIRPALQASTWVLSDRWVSSTLAYQCGGRGLTSTKINRILGLCELTTPDATVLCNTTPQTSAQRTRQRASRRPANVDSPTTDRFELAGLPFQENVFNYYIEELAPLSSSILIDTESLDVHQAADRTIRQLDSRFRLPPPGTAPRR